jgi:cbb3-type cytochrome oxidase maturation protein
MEIIVLLISISILIALAFLGAFIWSVRSGQYDDSYTPSIRVLFDDKKENNQPKA